MQLPDDQTSRDRQQHQSDHCFVRFAEAPDPLGHRTILVHEYSIASGFKTYTRLSADRGSLVM
jgi:hypothetical protein